MVRQPREPVEEPALLELPAGKLDKEGETPLRVRPARAGRGDRQVRRRLARAEELLHEPRVRRPRSAHLFLATELYDVPAEPDEDERIEIVEVPLAELDSTIDAARTPRRWSAC